MAVLDDVPSFAASSASSRWAGESITLAGMLVRSFGVSKFPESIHSPIRIRTIFEISFADCVRVD